MANQPSPQQDPPSPDPAASASATSRSRQQTEYIVLAVEPRNTHNATSTETEDTSKERFEVLGRVHAWNPKSALEALEADTLAEAQSAQLEVVLVPASSWHVFKPTTTFEEIK